MYEVPIYKCINQKEMKTKTIEVKFPTIKGMKVENASVDLKNGLSVVEYVEDAKFKRGDIVRLYTLDLIFIGIYSHDNNNRTYCFVDYIDGSLEYDDWGVYSKIQLASDSEKQLLFDALEKDGKYWDSESLEVKELSVNDKIDRILFDLRSCSESVVDASEKIKNIIDKEVNKAVNEIYK